MTRATIIVGAGFAGLTAAERLAAAGREVVVCEARDRVGGRVWSQRLPAADGPAGLIERGGEFITGGYDLTEATAARLGLGLDGMAINYPDRELRPGPGPAPAALLAGAEAAAAAAAGSPAGADAAASSPPSVEPMPRSARCSRRGCRARSPIPFDDLDCPLPAPSPLSGPVGGNEAGPRRKPGDRYGAGDAAARPGPARAAAVRELRRDEAVTSGCVGDAADLSRRLRRRGAGGAAPGAPTSTRPSRHGDRRGDRGDPDQPRREAGGAAALGRRRRGR